MNNNLTCPFKGKERGEACDKEKCVLWHEGGCVFVHIARALIVISDILRQKGGVAF